AAHVVREVSFSVPAGACFGLVGESGSGKTSTALAALGLLPPGAIVHGDVRVGNHSILSAGGHALRECRWTQIAMVPQAAMSSLNPVRSIGRQLEEVMRLRVGLGSGDARQRALELLERVGLARKTIRMYPHELSGGMRQRAVIALALSCSPRV